MNIYYVRKQCIHCKQSKNFASIKDDYDAAVTLASIMNDRAYKGFSFIVVNPPKFFANKPQMQGPLD